MVYYVEQANQFTLDHGDMWEQFYLSVENMFSRAVKQIQELDRKGKDTNSFRERLAKVVKSTSEIGWGYHDTLTDIYYEAFGEL